MKGEGVEVEDTLDQAEDALDRGDPEAALELCEEVLGAEAAHPGALFLAAEAHRDLRELPQAEVTIWPGSGHFPHLAQPGRFAELLTATARWA